MAGAVGIEPTLTVLETVVLPLNYAPIRWWLGTESNRRHKDFQSFALPTELPSLYENGGGRGIRTPAGFDTPVGFQDRSLQPDLGIPPYVWWSLAGSNR